jgi:hypothetical protein
MMPRGNPSLADYAGAVLDGAVTAVTEPFLLANDGIKTAMAFLASDPARGKLYEPRYSSHTANALVNETLTPEEFFNGLNPIYAGAVLGHEFGSGDGMARAGIVGGVLGAVALGAGLQKYGSSGGMTFGDINASGPYKYQRGSVNIQLVGKSEASSETRKFGPIAGETEPAWGEMVRRIEGEPPVDMVNPHGHHTVFKQGRGQKMQQYLNDSKNILESYDIDWYKGAENLGWAPNKNHSTAAAKAVRDALTEAHTNVGTREAVLDSLSKMKTHFRNDTIHTLFDK